MKTRDTGKVEATGGTTPRLPGVGRVLLGQLGYQLRLLARAPRAAFSAFVLPVLLLVAFH